MSEAGTKLGVIGWPISHSRSPLIHNHWLNALSLSGAYGLVPIDPAEDFRSALERLAAQGYRGANVTLPHKENAFEAMDDVSEAAQKLGAVNTISFEGGKMRGANTDGGGYLASLAAAAPDHDWRRRPALVIGAGGAARAICVALAGAGVKEIRLVNRTQTRAEALVPLAPEAIVVGAWETRATWAKGCGLIVNTTGLGMSGQPDLDMPLDAADDTALVSDIVYTPLETAFMRSAKARGLLTVGGLGMLVHQAALAFEIWFGQKPPLDAALTQKLVADIEER